MTCYDNDGGDCDGDDNWDDESPDYSYSYSYSSGPTPTCGVGYVADCSGDGDCCLESWIGDEICDGVDQVDGCDLSCFGNDGGDCDGDDNWDDESPDYSYSYSYSDNWDDKCLGQTACYPDGSPCATGEFCNFDHGSSGFCEPCSSFSEPTACYDDGLPSEGAADCHAC